MTSANPGTQLLATVGVELFGVGVFTVIAGFSEDVGNIMVIIMVGILLGWMLLNTTELEKLAGKL